MIQLRHLSLLAYRHARHTGTLSQMARRIATHSYSYHETALSVLPSGIDTSSTGFKDNDRQFGEILARMQELHSKIEQGGPQKAREKHIARGKMLVREYDI